MPTLHLILDERDLEFKLPKLKGVHSIKMHLENFEFSDDEIVQYAQAAGMMLLGAVQDAEIQLKDGGSTCDVASAKD